MDLNKSIPGRYSVAIVGGADEIFSEVMEVPVLASESAGSMSTASLPETSGMAAILRTNKSV